MRSRSTELWISSCMTGTPASSAFRLEPARSSFMVLRISATIAPDLELSATFGCSARTISASVPVCRDQFAVDQFVGAYLLDEVVVGLAIRQWIREQSWRNALAGCGRLALRTISQKPDVPKHLQAPHTPPLRAHMATPQSCTTSNSTRSRSSRDRPCRTSRRRASAMKSAG